MRRINRCPTALLTKGEGVLKRRPKAGAGDGSTCRAVPVEYFAEATLERVFVETTVLCPEAVALLGEEGSLCYGDLLVRAQNIAVALRKQGLRPGDLAGIAGYRTFATIAGTLGILLAGGVYVPFDPAAATTESGRERLRRQVEASRIPVLLVDEAAEVRRGEAGWRSWAGEAPVLDLSTAERDTLPPFAEIQLPGTAPEAPAAVLFDKGMRGVLVTHRGLMRMVTSRQLFQFDGAEPVLLHSAPQTHAHTLEMWSGLLHGVTVVLPRESGLPLDASGCTDRALLMQECGLPSGAGRGPGQVERAEYAACFEQVRGLWQRLLHRMQVGLDDDFYEAGGNSIQMIRMYRELNRRFPGSVTMADVPALTTIRKILQHLASDAVRGRMGALARRGA